VILGTSENSLESISIFPKPTHNMLTIVSPKASVTKLVVYDIRGRRVNEVSFKTEQTTYKVDLRELETALYFIEITTESGLITKRILKQ
jgi:hypothetical protein